MQKNSHWDSGQVPDYAVTSQVELGAGNHTDFPGVDQNSKHWKLVCKTIAFGNVSGSLMRATKAEREVWVVYGGHVVAWFCFGFILRSLNIPTRHVSAWVPLGLAAGAVYSVVVGFVMRRKFFVVPAEGVAVDSSRVLNRWRMGNFTGFAGATTITFLGFVLKILGSTWLLPGIFFGVGLGFLLLWRPRPLPLSMS